MKRKVIQLAVKTLVVSLPLEWAEKNGVKKGGEVEVNEKGDRLVISTCSNPEVLKIVLDTDEKKVFDKRYIGDLYIKGYDEIRINFKDKKVMEEIKKIDLLGYEIVDKGANYCVVKNVSSAMESEFDTMLRKCFILAKEMAFSISDFLDGNNINLSEVRKLEAENNKASVFCLRILNKNGYKETSKTTFMYVIAREIEAICDIFKYIIDDISEKGKASEKAVVYYKEVVDFFTSFYELFYKYDKEKFKKFYETRKELIKKGRHMKDEFLVHHSLNLVVAVYNICGPFLTMRSE